MKNYIDGCLYGYLLHTGTCELQLNNGDVVLYDFSPRLAKKIKTFPSILTRFLFKQVRLFILDINSKCYIDQIELTENSLYVNNI